MVGLWGESRGSSLSQQKDLDVDYVAYKPTRAKRGKPSWVESCADPLYETTAESSSSSPRKRMKENLTEFPDCEVYQSYRECFGDFVLEAEAAQQPRKTKTSSWIQKKFARAGICETCQSAEAIFNCLTFTGDHSWCQPCLITPHQSLPFHKIQSWNNMCFQDVTLADQGFIWYLGHGGEPCPSIGASTIYGHQDERVDNIETGPLPHYTTPVTMVHSSGVFTHNVLWCQCSGSNPQHLQLLRAGLFPASSTRPKTVFTFEVLVHFLIDALECKTSARSFFEKLTRLTNNAFPGTVPDRYRELMRVSRLWRDLKNRKWFGFGHDTESSPGPGDLALFCPSCPQPGINMPLCWEQKWLVMKRFVVDGNFTAQHMNMRQPEFDIFLSDGLGYMVTEGDYRAHLASATESKEQPSGSQCSKHKPKQPRATGVGATACARHGYFVPHCIVDFQKGEHGVFTLQNGYSLNFIVGAGQVDGEILETLWAPFNKISPTTRSMSQAHRQEILDDHMWNLNWEKHCWYCTNVPKKGIDDTKVPFEELTRSLEVSKVLSWEKDEKQAMDQRGEHLDIYQLKIDKEYANTGKSGSISWLISGINLEDVHSRDTLRVDIRQLLRDASASQKAVVEEKRQKVAARISKFHETADAMSDGIEVDADMEEQGHEAADLEVAEEETGEEVAAEGMGIWMPSSIHHQDALALGLGALQAEELQLQQGQANDCLEKLRQALGHKAIIYRQHFRSADSTWTRKSPRRIDMGRDLTNWLGFGGSTTVVILMKTYRWMNIFSHDKY
ncbi:hypothetical protein DFJ58DRAFT_842440 [Suillus subalutaceus]|uniref:uncharacterized protein n=1 Tax=Suillus subalutaceus TaxID=48586 RepID=UPI001B883105|nr:uncharacterized protein DFJ58DRAFT_842440 [Suillus subalutaceus]KAG1850364.1 hypothetical protein DFJ58DRAFT_842440 [Suillus subalutaceus]